MSKQSRDEAIDNLAELAASVLASNLSNPALPVDLQMPTLQAAVQLFSTKERYRIEDAQIEVARERIKLEAAQLPAGSVGLLSGNTFTQNNLIVSSQEDIIDRKQRAQKLLDEHARITSRGDE